MNKRAVRTLQALVYDYCRQTNSPVGGLLRYVKRKYAALPEPEKVKFLAALKAKDPSIAREAPAE